jgi:hypothetical protein
MFVHYKLFIYLLFKIITMSFVITFVNPGFTSAKYDETVKKLEAAGVGAPKGRVHHVSFGDPASLHVTDIWDNMEDFQAFGQVLMPILQSLGIDPGQPDIKEVHNIIVG